MDIIINKLNVITSIWNSIVLSHTYIQNRLDFDDSKRNNYYGEVMHLFYDTMPVLNESNSERFKAYRGMYDYIFNCTALLQILYVQQDLMDEILQIFQLQYSNSAEKKIIRELRNELIGHPISRDKNNNLVSSVFWIGKDVFTKSNDEPMIFFRKYSEGSWDNQTRNRIIIEDLINKHKRYLNMHFDVILTKQKKICKNFLKKVRQIKNISIRNDVDTLFSMIHEYLDLLNEDTIYSIKHVEKALNLIESAPRYENYYNIAIHEINQHIDETIHMLINEINDINEIFGLKMEEHSKYSEVEQVNTQNIDRIDMGMIPYYMSKLVEQKCLDYLELLRKQFIDVPEIIREIKHMEENCFIDDFEYYSAFMYLNYLIKEIYRKRTNV